MKRIGQVIMCLIEDHMAIRRITVLVALSLIIGIVIWAMRLVESGQELSTQTTAIVIEILALVSILAGLITQNYFTTRKISYDYEETNSENGQPTSENDGSIVRSDQSYSE